MSGPSERDEIAADRDALAELLRREFWRPDNDGQWPWPRIADAILASDLLAERDRRTAAKTLREAAEFIEADALTVRAKSFALTLPAAKGALRVVAQWLRDRADRIERGE